MVTKMRDNQQALVYNSEQMFRKVLDRSSEIPTIEIYGSNFVIAQDRNFGDLQSAQRYVDGILSLNWVKSTWDSVAGQKVTVVPRKGNEHAHYQNNTIALPNYLSKNGRNFWAMREVVVLHELAHHLTKFDARSDHGPLFAGTFVKLVKELMSEEDGFILTHFMLENGVKITQLD